MSVAAIATEDLTRRFGDLVAVDRINLRVDAGQFFGFLGPNGAGKSTRSESTRLNSSHQIISYAVFCVKKKIDRKQVLIALALAGWGAQQVCGMEDRHFREL